MFFFFSSSFLLDDSKIPSEIDPSISIMDAVGSLPMFASTKSVPKPPNQSRKTPSRDRPSKKTATQSNTVTIQVPVHNPEIEQVLSNSIPEYNLTYPSGVVGVCISSDGSAQVRWPNGSIALSVDREIGVDNAQHPRELFRIFARHKNGGLAVTVDPNGNISMNYESGKTFLSQTTNSSGFAQEENGSLICRWGKNETNEGIEIHGEYRGNSEANSLLSDEPRAGKCVQAQLGTNIGTRFYPLTQHLEVYFKCKNVHHCFIHGPNSGKGAISQPSDLFGRPTPSAKLPSLNDFDEVETKKQDDKANKSISDITADLSAMLAGLNEGMKKK